MKWEMCLGKEVCGSETDSPVYLYPTITFTLLSHLALRALFLPDLALSLRQPSEQPIYRVSPHNVHTL